MIYVQFTIDTYTFYMRQGNRHEQENIYDYILQAIIEKEINGEKIKNYKEFLTKELKLDIEKIIQYNINSNMLYIKDKSIYIGQQEIDLDHQYSLKLILEKIKQDISITTHCILIDQFLYYSFTKSLNIEMYDGKYIFDNKEYESYEELYEQIKEYIQNSEDFMFQAIEDKFPFS